MRSSHSPFSVETLAASDKARSGMQHAYDALKTIVTWQKHLMTYQDVAQRFGDLIARKDYSAAWKLLSKEAQISITPEAIRAAEATMLASAPGPILEAQVMDDCVVEDWPGKQQSDLAVVYVALTGESFSEAVTLTLAQYGEDTLIRHLEWGRP